MQLHNMDRRMRHDALCGSMFGTNMGCCWACRAELSKGSHLPSRVAPLLVHIDEEDKSCDA